MNLNDKELNLVVRGGSLGPWLDAPKPHLSSLETIHELKRLIDNAIEMEKAGLMRDCSPEEREHYRKMYAYDLVLGNFGVKRIG